MAKGAKPGELLIEAARRNNTDLLQEVIDGAGSPEKAAALLNETKTVLGNYVYHEAALRGNCMFQMLFCLPTYLNTPKLTLPPSNHR
jgi:hypothetical protein